MASEPVPALGVRLRTRRRRIAIAVWAGLATFAALLVLDGIWAGTTLLRSLTRARSELNVAIESVVTGDADAAVPHFAAAREAADRALAAAAHPSIGLAGLLPIADENVDAASAVARASLATADAGRAMVDVALSLGWNDVGLPAADAAGRLDVAAMEAALPAMEFVARRLQQALGTLETVGGDGLVGPVASGYRDAVEGLDRRADLAVRFRDALRLVPAMFGGEETRRYLLVVPSMGIPTPGGGTPTSVGLLTSQAGTLDLDTLIAAPDELTEVDFSPDWPTSARRLLEAAGAAAYPDLDGVIQLDAAGLEDLVWVSGDVPVDGRSRSLMDRTTVNALEIEAYQRTSLERAAELHAAWSSAIVARFLEERPGVESFALALAAGARDRHVSIFLVDEEAERLVRAVGFDGRIRLAGRGMLPVLTTWTASGPAHVGALVDTSIRQNVTIREDGSAAVEVEVLFDNRSASEVPSVLLGRPGSGLPVGTFASDVTLFLPKRSRDVVAETSVPSPIEVGRGLGLETVTGSISVRGGDSTTLTVTYVVEDAVVSVEGTNAVVLRLVPQTTIRGVAYQIRVALPEGSTIVGTSPGLEPRGTAAIFADVRSGAVDLELRYVS